MMDKKDDLERDKKRCEECGSTLTYVRLKTSEKLCRTCGHVEKIKEERDNARV